MSTIESNATDAPLNARWFATTHWTVVLGATDGNVKYFNFTKRLRDNPQYPAEPTPETIWYKAASDQ